MTGAIEGSGKSICKEFIRIKGTYKDFAQVMPVCVRKLFGLKTDCTIAFIVRQVRLLLIASVFRRSFTWAARDLTLVTYLIYERTVTADCQANLII